MKNSTRFLKSILIIPTMLLFQLVKGQIVYTDVNPDETYTANWTGAVNYPLDLNHDGVNDFNLAAGPGPCNYSSSGHQATIEHLTGSIALTGPVGYNAAKLETNETINSQNVWDDLVTSPLYLRFYGPGCFPIGIWKNNVDNYAGLRIPASAGNWYYGWAKLSVNLDGGESFTIKEYAFNSKPNEAVLAGQTCPPQASISANGPTAFCTGDSVVLSSVNPGTNLSYQWKLNSMIIPGATSKNYTAKTMGKYKVKVMDNTNNCSTVSPPVIVKTPCKTTSEVINSQMELLLNVYPNPFFQSTTVSFNLPYSQEITIRIFDVHGRLIRQLANENMDEGANTITWNSRDENGDAVDAGIYFLKLETGGELKVVRLAVVR
jgi:hypothetical protein